MKLDLDQKSKLRVPSEEGEDFSVRLNHDRLKDKERFAKPFFETSSKTGQGVDEVFEYIFQTLLTHGKPLSPQKSIVDLEGAPPQREKPTCC